MKLIKTASGKQQIKMSREEWESIGKTAGWDKEEVPSSFLSKHEQKALEALREQDALNRKYIDRIYQEIDRAGGEQVVFNDENYARFEELVAKSESVNENLTQIINGFTSYASQAWRVDNDLDDLLKSLGIKVRM